MARRLSSGGRVAQSGRARFHACPTRSGVRIGHSKAQQLCARYNAAVNRKPGFTERGRICVAQIAGRVRIARTAAQVRRGGFNREQTTDATVGTQLIACPCRTAFAHRAAFDAISTKAARQNHPCLALRSRRASSPLVTSCLGGSRLAAAPNRRH